MFTLEIPGPPQGKARLRHRVNFRKGSDGKVPFAQGYTPAKTVAYQAAIAADARAQWGARAPLAGAVFLHVTAYKPIPVSWSRAKQDAARCGDLRPTSKPDWDNFGKVASDALNTIVFQDDAQVADAFVQKYYSDNPRLRIVVCDLQKVSSHDGSDQYQSVAGSLARLVDNCRAA